MPSEPLNTSVVSLVMKSVELTPVSTEIDPIVTVSAAEGGCVSITTFWCAVCSVEPAALTILTCTSYVPSAILFAVLS